MKDKIIMKWQSLKCGNSEIKCDPFIVCFFYNEQQTWRQRQIDSASDSEQNRCQSTHQDLCMIILGLYDVELQMVNYILDLGVLSRPQCLVSGLCVSCHCSSFLHFVSDDNKNSFCLVNRSTIQGKLLWMLLRQCVHVIRWQTVLGCIDARVFFEEL